MPTNNRPCFCHTNACKGTAISYNEYRRHQRMDQVRRRRNDYTHPLLSIRQALDAQRLNDQIAQTVTEKVFDFVLSNDSGNPQESVDTPSGHSIPTPEGSTPPTQTTYEYLYHLDNEIHNRILRAYTQVKEVEHLPAVCPASKSIIASLRDTSRWVSDCILHVEQRRVTTDAEVLLKTSMLERLPEVQSRLNSILDTLQARDGWLPHDFNGNIFHTGMHFSVFTISPSSRVTR